MWEQSERRLMLQGVMWGQRGDWLRLYVLFALYSHGFLSMIMLSSFCLKDLHILFSGPGRIFPSDHGYQAWSIPCLSFDSQLKCPLLQLCLIVQTMAAMWHNSVLGTLYSGVV